MTSRSSVVTGAPNAHLKMYASWLRSSGRTKSPSTLPLPWNGSTGDRPGWMVSELLRSRVAFSPEELNFRTFPASAAAATPKVVSRPIAMRTFEPRACSSCFVMF